MHAKKLPCEPSAADWAVRATPFPATLPVRAASVKLWLDVLPSDVRTRIAAYVSEGGHQTDALLALAQTSLMQRDTVLSILSYSLCFDTTSEEHSHLPEWAAVFHRDIQQLLVRYDGQEHEVLPDRLSPFLSRKLDESLVDAFAILPLTLFSAPRLHRIEAFASPTVLKAIKHSSSVRYISLLIQYEESRGDDALLKHVLQALAALRESLRSLSLICMGLSRKSCAFVGLLRMHNSGHSLSDACPLLTSLTLSCRYHPERVDNQEPYGAVDFLWRCLPTLRALRELAIKGTFDGPLDDIIPMLRGIESVKLCSDQAFRIGTRLGQCVTSLVTSRSVCYWTLGISALSRCIRLKNLQLTLVPGSECEFFRALRLLSSLCSLTLNWAWFLDENFIEIFQELGQMSGPAETKYHLLLESLESLPLLSKLRLLYTRMPVSCMVMFIERIGKNLKHLTLPFAKEPDEEGDSVAYEELPALFEAILEHCPGLRSLSVGVSVRSYPKSQGPRTVERVALKKRLLGPTLRRLQRASPMLDVRDVQLWMNEMPKASAI